MGAGLGCVVVVVVRGNLSVPSGVSTCNGCGCWQAGLVEDQIPYSKHCKCARTVLETYTLPQCLSPL